MLRHPHINRRWAVPAIALLGVLGVGAIPPLFQSAGASTPDLPTLSPAELLAKARTAQVTSLSGTVTLTSNLGIPSLGSLGGRGLTSLTDLLAGQHSAKVWIDGVDHFAARQFHAGRITGSAEVFTREEVRIAEEIGDEHVGRRLIEQARRADLGDAPLMHHGDHIGHLSASAWSWVT